MFTIGTQSAEVVDLADDSEAISLMLGFIYPSSIPPIVNTFELLEKSLQIAQKYHIETMLQKIDRALPQETPYKNLLKERPLHMLQLCAKYELRETQTAVAKLVWAGSDGLLKTEVIVELAKQNPGSAHIIGVLGAQLARENILRTLLLDLTGIPSFLASSDACNLSCEACQNRHNEDDGTSELSFYPGWLHRWGSLVYKSLSAGNWDDNAHLFTLGVLQKLRAPDVNGPTCWNCIDTSRSAQSGRLFERWAMEVKQSLKFELDKLDVLYSL